LDVTDVVWRHQIKIITCDGSTKIETTGGGIGSLLQLQPRIESRELKTVSRELKCIMAEHVSRQELEAKLREVAKHDRCSETFTKTLLTCVDVLASGVGGMIVSIVHEDLLQQELSFDFLDGGLHTRCFRDVCKNLGGDTFAIMLELLTAHNETDRWEPQELVELCKKIPKAQEYREDLLGQPKDGAITISHQSTVKGAAMHLKYPSEKFQLRKKNGSAAGTRHASALGFAEHLCNKFESDFLPGVVFARSDGGGAHAFIPQPSGVPLALHFDTLSIPTQQDMLKYFKDIIIAKGRLLRKEQPVLARAGTDKEQVISVVEGKVTSTRTVSPEFMVIRANTPDQEYYALKKNVFEKNYEVPGTPLDVSEKLDNMEEFTRNSCKQLMSKGFLLYKPRLDACRWAYEVTEEDMKHFPTSCFQAPWDASILQPLRKGDILGMPAPEDKATEIYWMHRHALSAYTATSLEELGLVRQASVKKYAEGGKDPAAAGSKDAPAAKRKP